MKNATFLYSDLLNPIEALTKERDQLLTTAENLREKLKETIGKQQEIDAQRDAALENIAQVNSPCDLYLNFWSPTAYFRSVCWHYMKTNKEFFSLVFSALQPIWKQVICDSSCSFSSNSKSNRMRFPEKPGWRRSWTRRSRSCMWTWRPRQEISGLWLCSSRKPQRSSRGLNSSSKSWRWIQTTGRTQLKGNDLQTCRIMDKWSFSCHQFLS